jgi:hypothetical protein
MYSIIFHDVHTFLQDFGHVTCGLIFDVCGFLNNLKGKRKRKTKIYTILIKKTKN